MGGRGTLELRFGREKDKRRKEEWGSVKGWWWLCGLLAKQMALNEGGDGGWGWGWGGVVNRMRKEGKVARRERK